MADLSLHWLCKKTDNIFRSDYWWASWDIWIRLCHSFLISKDCLLFKDFPPCIWLCTCRDVMAGTVSLIKAQTLCFHQTLEWYLKHRSVIKCLVCVSCSSTRRWFHPSCENVSCPRKSHFTFRNSTPWLLISAANRAEIVIPL